MNQNFLETLIGGLILCLSIGILAFSYVHYRDQLPKGYVLQAQFQRVDGLTIGSDVKMGGIKIGQVISQSLDPKTFMATVAFSVPPTLKIPKDSSATVMSESLLGGKYLDLSPGGEDESLAPNGTISHTQSSVNMESLIGKMIFSQTNEKK